MKKSKKNTITLHDFLKAVRKGNRDAQLEKSPGWIAVTKIHKSKKIYSRKNRKIDF